MAGAAHVIAILAPKLRLLSSGIVNVMDLNDDEENVYSTFLRADWTGFSKSPSSGGG
jgi:hypothetical protein